MCATLADGQSDQESEELLVPQGPADWTRIHCEGLANELFHLVYLLKILPMDSILQPRDLQDIDDATKVIQTKRALHLLFNEKYMRWIMSMIFYSEDAETRSFLFLFSALAGAGFGSIHFFAWHIDFPSSAERILWRTASLCIIGAFSASSQELLCINMYGENDTLLKLRPFGMLVNPFRFPLLFILFPAFPSLFSPYYHFTIFLLPRSTQSHGQCTSLTFDLHIHYFCAGAAQFTYKNYICT